MKSAQKLSPYQEEFIEFLVSSGALSFGEFTLKSGRKAPYFVNTGSFDSGSKIDRLGSFYAAHIMEVLPGLADVIFGPAYKGVPLCVATAQALHRDFGREIGFSFNRKEAKDHGDKGNFVGRKISRGDKVIVVEDVITAGTTLQEILPLLRDDVGAKVEGVIIAVDRCEKGSGNLSAVEECRQSYGVKIFPLVTVHQIVSHLSKANKANFILSSEQRARIDEYLKQYGC